jgi:hypothetical protein
MRTPHTSTYKGKRVSIKLRDGGLVIGKFYDKKHNTVELGENKFDKEQIPIRNIKSFKIFKLSEKDNVK